MRTILRTNDCLEQNQRAAILRFAGKRKVLSTGALGGGLRTDLTTAFNFNDCPRAAAYCEMYGNTLEEHQIWTARQLSLDPRYTTGLDTGANIDNTAIRTLSCEDFTVTAIVTAGLEGNGCRVGDPATLHERRGESVMLGGTVNIFLVVDADLSDRCMTRALVTCTEAKVAALQELLVVSRYAPTLATGSGTDGIVIISNSESPIQLNEAGEQYKLGECIGRVVIQAVKDALYRQTGLSAEMQHNAFRRMGRFGVTEAALWKGYCAECDNPVSFEKFRDLVHMMSLDGTLVTMSSLYAHLIDQVQWGLLLPHEAVWAGNCLLKMMDKHYALPSLYQMQDGQNPETIPQQMAQAFNQAVIRWLLESIT